MDDHAYYAYLEVTSVDAFYAEVTGRGAEVVKPLRDEPWGMREFGIRTADGHRMMFGAPVGVSQGGVLAIGIPLGVMSS